MTIASLLKSLNIKYIVILGVLAILLATFNNLRQPETRRVSWIGGQDVLARPAPEAQ